MITPPMRAAIALCALALFIANSANAQNLSQNLFGDKFTIAAGGETGIVTGVESPYRTFDLGATLQAQYRLTDNVAFTLTSGLYNFFSKNYTAYDVEFGGGPYSTPSGSLGIIPFKAGIKVFTGKHFYFSAEAGTWYECWGDDFFTASDDFESNVPRPKVSKLLLAGGCGWFLKNIDIGFRYDRYAVQFTGYNTYNYSVYWGTATFHVAYIIR
jgi:hypothetical protein